MSMSINLNKNQSGLTLVEIMVAVFIFAMSIIAIVRSQTNSSRNYKQTQNETLAALLAQHIMVQAEAQFDNKPFSDTTETDSGAGEGIFAPFKWQWTLAEVPFEIPSLAAFLPQGGDGIETAQADKFLMLAQILNQNLKKALRELSVIITWTPFEGAEPKTFSLTTHLVDLTVEPSFMGAAAGAAGGGDDGG